MEVNDPLVDKATRLFTFLAKSQRLKERPVRDVEKYKRDGMVRWMSELPEHPAIRWSDAGTSLDEPLIVIDRLERIEPPAVPASIRRWVDGDEFQSELRPRLHAQITDSPRWDDDNKVYVEDTVLLDDRPEVMQRFDRWIAEWDEWAVEETTARPVREAYKAAYGAHVTSTQNAEENELILGLGLIAWDHAKYDAVRRHMFTLKVDIEVNARTGSLEVLPDSEAIGLTAELDMLDPAIFPTRELPRLTEERAAGYSTSALNRQALEELGSMTVYALDPEGKYVDEGGSFPPGRVPTLSWSPALILRPRPKTGLAQAFEQIAADIEKSGTVPAGLRPLLNPGEAPSTQPDPSPGALLNVDEEIFSPLPLNEVQRRILERVDTNAQTLVQGPPGTGKTHTAAALLAHLLAQGKRVLVTAHTDRALYEVRGKLPELIRPLAVSVIGASRSDMAELRTAVDTISRNATEHNPADADSTIEKNLRSVELLRSQRQTLNEQLIDSREREITHHQSTMYSGTLSSISQAHASDRDQFGWIEDFVDQPRPDVDLPSDKESLEWLGYLRDDRLAELARLRGKRTLDVDSLPSPERFVELSDSLSTAAARTRTFHSVTDHPAREPLSHMEPGQRREFQLRLHAVMDLVKETSQLRAEWVDDAIHDMRVGITQVWSDRYRDITSLLAYVDERTRFLGYDTRIVANGDVNANMQLAAALREFVTSGNEIKTHIDGSAKFGLFTPPVVKQCRPFLDNVRVNGRAPTTPDLLDRFTAYQESWWALERMDRGWPAGTVVPPEDTLTERASWHRVQCHMLQRVLRMREQLNEIDEYVRQRGMPTIDWSDFNSVINYGSVVDAVAAEEDYEEASSPLRSLYSGLDDVARWDDAADWIVPMRNALDADDRVKYTEAYGRASELDAADRTSSRSDELTQRLNSALPKLVEAVHADPAKPEWSTQLAGLNPAHDWALTRQWLTAQEGLDANKLQEEIARIESRIQSAAEAIAAMRAWNHAVGTERLSLGSRADLTQYSQLVRRLGKGTGKYASQQRAEIRESLDRCRPSVPVWIMPIYRVVEQLRISENMFDVVLIDEASQAGLEASFLQYLAPKIVVIGDDKQVSPSAVGVDQKAIRELADQYLHDDRYKSTWQNPDRSLFDEAVMRYGGQLTLTEHRRCVPEIIGFSNRIAYEPEGIRLVPVRQFGADRLEPFKVTRTADAYQEGPTSNKINKGEARALIDALKECFEDPAYDGRTFGVISLLGHAQAKYVEGLLLDEVPADDWESRQLQVGSPADFQGSERDVIFLTMVSSVEPGTRLAALTRDMYVQRYNVAVSRAKDQVWLFHTLRASDLTNEQDLRFQLLDYVYGVRQRGRELHAGESPSVPDDERVEGYDSLFEQRVYNRIVDRGFTVVPQFEAQGYRIDLVIVGANGRLAIECDGDHWHGPDAYSADLARQRDLERCGWSFFRIRESAFYADKAAALAPLWEALRELEIHPADFHEEFDDEAAVQSASLRELSAAEDVVYKAELVATTADDTGAIGHDFSPSARSSLSDTSPAAEAESFDYDDVAETFAAEESIQRERGIDIEVAESDDRAAVVPPPPAPSPISESLEMTHPMTREVEHNPDSTEEDDESETTGRELRQYGAYLGSTKPVGDSTRAEIIHGLTEIIGTEGPVTGERLQRAYVTASGGMRVGRAIAKELNAAISHGVRAGQFVADNPLNQPGVKPKTYRLNGQPLVCLRALGPRSLDEVPPTEIAAAMHRAHDVFGAVTDDEIMRHTLWHFGRKTLTQTVRDHLGPILVLIRREEQDAE